jgi:CubicO group peptidase (beta-lactamase class C family)
MPRPNCVLRGLGLRGWATVLIPAFVALPIAVQTVAAAEATPVEASIEQRVQALVPSLEDYIATNMKSFDVPGLAIGIVAGDKLIYAKGFGVRGEGGAPVDTRTIFQIGSTTKAFLSATMAIAVDRGKLHWDDRVVDLVFGQSGCQRLDTADSLFNRVARDLVS